MLQKALVLDAQHVTRRRRGEKYQLVKRVKPQVVDLLLVTNSLLSRTDLNDNIIPELSTAPCYLHFMPGCIKFKMLHHLHHCLSLATPPLLVFLSASHSLSTKTTRMLMSLKPQVLLVPLEVWHQSLPPPPLGPIFPVWSFKVLSWVLCLAATIAASVNVCQTEW